MESKMKQPTLAEQIERLEAFAHRLEAWAYQTKQRLAGVNKKVDLLKFEATREGHSNHSTPWPHFSPKFHEWVESKEWRAKK